MRQMIPAQLDITHFNRSKYEHYVNKCLDLKFRFFFLSETEDTAENRRKLYDIVAKGVLESPQSDGTFESYDQFINKLFKPYYWDVGESQLIAEVDDAWVGLTSIIVDKVSGEGKTGLTVVSNLWRNNGLAKALKAISLARAKAQGAKVIVTENHVTNAPMIKVNQTFGFEYKESDLGNSGTTSL